MKTQQLTVTTLGALIEEFESGSCVEFRRNLSDIYGACVQAIRDDKMKSGRRKYSADARASFPYRDGFSDLPQDLLFEWWTDAFWSWREMLTPNDFETLNRERVILSEVAS